MQKGLVSVLTPAFNTAGYISKLLESVLAQTYHHIEMIVIDDGSTDNTANVVNSYMQRFKNRGYSLDYFYQENAGQSVAIKNGLQKVKGEYLVWPDSDDYYSSSEAIEKMVRTLNSSSSIFQMVRTQECMVHENTGEILSISGLKAHEEEPMTLFEDCLCAQNGFFFTPGAYMVRTDTLYELTKFDIYTSKNAGQNWQLMLPILYNYRCKTIMEPLYHVAVRELSHSRGQYRGYEATRNKYEAYFNTQIETLKRIQGFPISLVEKYKKQLSVKYGTELFRLAIKENRRLEAQTQLQFYLNNASLLKRLLVPPLFHLIGITYLLNGIWKVTHINI